jgi:hypothetical protein
MFAIDNLLSRSIRRSVPRADFNEILSNLGKSHNTSEFKLGAAVANDESKTIISEPDKSIRLMVV